MSVSRRGLLGGIAAIYAAQALPKLPALYDSVSMRALTSYEVGADVTITELDTFYGYMYIRPEWALNIPDFI